MFVGRILLGSLVDSRVFSWLRWTGERRREKVILYAQKLPTTIRSPVRTGKKNTISLDMWYRFDGLPFIQQSNGTLMPSTRIFEDPASKEKDRKVGPPKKLKLPYRWHDQVLGVI